MQRRESIVRVQSTSSAGQALKAAQSTLEVVDRIGRDVIHAVETKSVSKTYAFCAWALMARAKMTLLKPCSE